MCEQVTLPAPAGYHLLSLQEGRVYRFPVLAFILHEGEILDAIAASDERLSDVRDEVKRALELPDGRVSAMGAEFDTQHAWAAACQRAAEANQFL